MADLRRSIPIIRHQVASTAATSLPATSTLAFRCLSHLQLLDFLTTLIGFRLGASEASPFIVKLIHPTSPALGVGASKMHIYLNSQSVLGDQDEGTGAYRHHCGVWNPKTFIGCYVQFFTAFIRCPE